MRATRISIGLVAGLILVTPLLTAAAAGATPAPPGNNGTVKVEGEPIDHLHDNDPHVGCAFLLQWYGFDQGSRTSSATFVAQPPTGSGQTLLTETVTFDGHGSGNTLDHQQGFDLNGALASFTPSAQGYHVKLTVETDGSQGANVKHKVFWVSGCASPAGPSTAPQQSTMSSNETPVVNAVAETTTTTIPVSSTTPIAPSVLGTEITAPVAATAPSAMETSKAVVEGEAITRAPAAARVAGGALPRTGADDIATTVAVAVAMIALGAIARRRSRTARNATTPSI